MSAFRGQVTLDGPSGTGKSGSRRVSKSNCMSTISAMRRVLRIASSWPGNNAAIWAVDLR